MEQGNSRFKVPASNCLYNRSSRNFRITLVSGESIGKMSSPNPNGEQYRPCTLACPYFTVTSAEFPIRDILSTRDFPKPGGRRAASLLAKPDGIIFANLCSVISMISTFLVSIPAVPTASTSAFGRGSAVLCPSNLLPQALQQVAAGPESESHLYCIVSIGDFQHLIGWL